MSESRFMASPGVCRPSAISLDSWFTAIILPRCTAVPGTYLKVVLWLTPSSVAVAKMEFVSTYTSKPSIS